METAKINLSVVVARRKTGRHVKPPVDESTLVHKQVAARRLLAEDPRLRQRDRGGVPRSQLAGEEHDHQPGEAARRAQDLRGAPEFIEDATHGLRQRADERARLAVPAVADRLDRPVQRSAAPPVHPARVAAAARSSEARRSTRCTSRPTRRSPGLTHRYPDKALFLALDTCPVYCRFCTRSYAVGIDTDEVEKVHLKVDERALGARVRVHRVAPRARGHRHLRRRRVPAARRADHARSATRCSTMPQHPPHPLRDQGPGGHAAEDPHRRRVDRRAHARRRAAGASCTRRSCSTRTSTTRTRSPASPKTR